MRLLALLLFGVASLSAWPNGYVYRRALTVNAAQIPSTQTDFAAVISGTFDGTSGTPDLRTVANGGKVQHTCTQATIARTVPCDVAVTSDAAGSTVLAHYFEVYSETTGAAVIWLKVPSASNGTVVYLFYGASAVSTDQTNANGAWNSSYIGAWNLSDGATLNLQDSTSNTITLTNNNTTSATTGKLDGAAGFNGTSQSLQRSSASALDNAFGSGITIASWVNITAGGGTLNGIIAIKQKADSGGVNNLRWSNFWKAADGKICMGFSLLGTWADRVCTTAAVSTDTWIYVVGTYDGSTAKIFIDGSLNNSASVSGSIEESAGGSFYIGRESAAANEFFKGSIDQVTVLNVPADADTVTARYNNQSAPLSFWSIGAEQVTAVSHRVVQ